MYDFKVNNDDIYNPNDTRITIFMIGTTKPKITFTISNISFNSMNNTIKLEEQLNVLNNKLNSNNVQYITKSFEKYIKVDRLENTNEKNNVNEEITDEKSETKDKPKKRK